MTQARRLVAETRVSARSCSSSEMAKRRMAGSPFIGAQEPEVTDPYEEECIIMQELAQLKGEQEPPDEP